MAIYGRTIDSGGEVVAQQGVIRHTIREKDPLAGADDHGHSCLTPARGCGIQQQPFKVIERNEMVAENAIGGDCILADSELPGKTFHAEQGKEETKSEAKDDRTDPFRGGAATELWIEQGGNTSCLECALRITYKIEVYTQTVTRCVIKGEYIIGGSAVAIGGYGMPGKGAGPPQPEFFDSVLVNTILERQQLCRNCASLHILSCRARTSRPRRGPHG